MMIRILSAVILLIFAAPASAQTNTLFIGNSLTFTHDIHKLVAEIAAEKSRDLTVVSWAPGGKTLEDHNKSEELAELIKSEKWDVVVIQGHSHRTAFPLWQRERQVFPHAEELIQKIRAANRRTDIVLYMTFAPKNGDQHNAEKVPEISTYEGMQEIVIETYKDIAKQNNVRNAPVGRVWRYLRRNHPELELYNDPRHQNETGAYVIACTIFMTIFESNTCRGSSVPESLGLSADDTNIIQRAIDAIL